MGDEAKAQTPASDAASAADTTPQIDVENVTLDQLDTLMTTGSAELPTVGGGGEAVKVEEPTPPAEPEPPEPPKAAEPPAEPEPPVEPVEPEPPAAPEPPVPPKGEDDMPDRFRYKDPVDRAINALKKARDASGSPVTWAEAEAMVKGEAKSPEPPAPTINLTEVVSTLETEVGEIQRQLTEAGANEGVYDANIAKLNIELADKMSDLKLAKRDLKQAAQQEAADQAQAAEASKAARATAKAKAIELYPAAADDSTPLGKALKERIEAMRDPDHPDHAILYADSAPLTIVREVASELGVQPVAKAAAPATPPVTPPAVPPKSKMVPASGAKSSVVAPANQEDAKKQLERLKNGNDVTLEELDAMFEPEGQQKTLASVAGR